MNVLVEDAVVFLTDRGVQEIFPLLIFIVLRPIGLMYGFSVFLWGMGTARIVRVSIAVALGIPMVLADFDRIAELLITAPFLLLGTIAVIEIVLGLVLGLIGSLPFFAVQYAGAITDQFRGESDSGLTAPTGGTVTTFGLLYTVIAILAFMALDGLQVTVAALYLSYEFWPLGELPPELTSDSLTSVMRIFTDSLFLCIRIALPLLIVLLAIELTIGIGARVALRFNFYNLAFPVKNLAAVVLLPVIAYYVWLQDNALFREFFANFGLVQVTQ